MGWSTKNIYFSSVLSSIHKKVAFYDLTIGGTQKGAWIETEDNIIIISLIIQIGKAYRRKIKTLRIRSYKKVSKLIFRFLNFLNFFLSISLHSAARGLIISYKNLSLLYFHIVFSG